MSSIWLLPTTEMRLNACKDRAYMLAVPFPACQKKKLLYSTFILYKRWNETKLSFYQGVLTPCFYFHSSLEQGFKSLPWVIELSDNYFGHMTASWPKFLIDNSFNTVFIVDLKYINTDINFVTTTLAARFLKCRGCARSPINIQEPRLCLLREIFSLFYRLAAHELSVCGKCSSPHLTCFVVA